MLGPQEPEWMNKCVLVGKSVGSECQELGWLAGLAMGLLSMKG